MEITVRKLREYYIIFLNGEFYCSCDNLREVDDEIANIKGE